MSGPASLAGTTAVLRLETTHGRWETAGVDRFPGIVPESINPTANEWGPETLELQLRRRPNDLHPDLAAFTPAELEVDGQLVWSGRVRETPLREGAESHVQLSGQGWQFHLDDDTLRRTWVHTRMEDYRDVREVVLRAGNDESFPPPYQIEVEAGRIFLAMPPQSGGVAVGSAGAVVLDLGAPDIGYVYLEHSDGHYPNADEAAFTIGWQISDSPGFFSTGLQVLRAGAAAWPRGRLSYGSSLPEILGNKRALHLVIVASPPTQLYQGAPDPNTGVTYMPGQAEAWAQFHLVRVFRKQAYHGGGGRSVLKVTDIVKDVLLHAPLLSPSTSRIAQTTFSIPAFGTDGAQPLRAVLEAANALHDYRVHVNPERLLVFEPKPASPKFEVGAWSGAEFEDASANTAEEIYNVAVVEHEDRWGVRHSIVRFAAGAVSAAERRIEPVSNPALVNPGLEDDPLDSPRRWEEISAPRGLDLHADPFATSHGLSAEPVPGDDYTTRARLFYTPTGEIAYPADGAWNAAVRELRALVRGSSNGRGTGGHHRRIIFKMSFAGGASNEEGVAQGMLRYKAVGSSRYGRFLYGGVLVDIDGAGDNDVRLAIGSIEAGDETRFVTGGVNHIAAGTTAYWVRFTADGNELTVDLSTHDLRQYPNAALVDSLSYTMSGARASTWGSDSTGERLGGSGVRYLPPNVGWNNGPNDKSVSYITEYGAAAEDSPADSVEVTGWNVYVEDAAWSKEGPVWSLDPQRKESGSYSLHIGPVPHETSIRAYTTGEVAAVSSHTWRAGVTYRFDVRVWCDGEFQVFAGARGDPLNQGKEVVVGSGGWQTVSVYWNPAEDTPGWAVRVQVKITGRDISEAWIDRIEVLRAWASLPDWLEFRRQHTLEIGTAVDFATAAQMGDVFLRARRSTPLRGTLTVTRGGARLVKGGDPVPPAALLRHYGEKILFSHRIDPDTGDWGRVGTIASVAYDHATETATLAIDNSRSNFENLLARYAVVVGE